MSDNLRHTRYGSLPTGAPPAEGWTWSQDLRAVTSGDDIPDDSRWLEPGTVKVALLLADGLHPLGELRVRLDGRDINVVAELTGREGLWELTLAMVRGCTAGEPYRGAIRAWLGC